jgi:hypothetical protein
VAQGGDASLSGEDAKMVMAGCAQVTSNDVLVADFHSASHWAVRRRAVQRHGTSPNRPKTRPSHKTWIVDRRDQPA